MKKEAQGYDGHEAEKQVKAKSKMGKVQFASLRKVFQVLQKGGGIPKHNYSYRIDSGKLVTAIAFIQESLLMKPGVARDARIGGNTFKNMPVYERWKKY